MAEKESIFYEDLRCVNEVPFIAWEELKNKTILLTGATGLIGAAIVNALNYVNKQRELNLRLLALVRDEERAKNRFADVLNDGMLKFIVGSVENLPEVSDDINYVLHGASQTASKEFVNHAVETIQTSVIGTRNLLELSKRKKVQGFVFLSSMEVYGYPEKGHKIRENEIGTFTPLNLRNSYPISKIMCETMCCAYASEYGVPAMMVRLTQTFGPGVNYNDNRVFAYFARCVKEKKNIILKTRGETERCYLYTADAVTAILSVLLKGKPGTAYNAADESTYCSIAEMAEKVAEDGGIKVEYDIQDVTVNGFPDTLYMDLDTTALKETGWMPIWGGKTIEEMYSRIGW